MASMLENMEAEDMLGPDLMELVLQALVDRSNPARHR
jgi:hypothetical protein